MQVPGTNIEIEFSGESFEVAGRGTVWTARLLTGQNKDDLACMVGKKIENPEGIFSEIKGVESFAVFEQRIGTPIGLLLEPLEKPF